MHKNNSECSKIASKILNFTENQGWRVHEGNRRYRESNGKLCKEILLFKTTDIGMVKYCQNIFTFMLPSARLSRLKTRFLASYSSVDNSVCRHILFLFIHFDSVSLVTFVCLFSIVYYQVYGEYKYIYSNLYWRSQVQVSVGCSPLRCAGLRL